MHRLFLVRELQQQILDNFLPDFDTETLTFAPSGAFGSYLPGGPSRMALLNIALTCRALKEAGLDALWWAMDDITPLFAMLKGYREVNIVVRGGISQSEIDKFFAYARRIRLFYSRRPLAMSFTACMRVLWASEYRCLLPSLKYLLCECDHPDLVFLGSPNLRVLNASNEYAHPEARAFPEAICALVDSLPNVAPHLVGLRLWHEMTSDCLRAIEGLPSLKCLHVNNSLPRDFEEEIELKTLDSAFFLQLSTVSHLRRVELHGYMHIALEEKCIRLSTLTFSMLKTLELRVYLPGHIKELTDMFRMATFPSLQCFRAFCYCPSPPYCQDSETKVQTLHEFATSLIRATSLQHFCHLDIISAWDSEDLFQTPLATFPSLLCLHLKSPKTNLLAPATVEDIRCMSVAWPNLTDLRLETSIGLRFDVLIAIGQCFQALHELALNIDLLVLPEPDSVPILIRHPLSCFDTCHYKFYPPDPVKFARCLDRLLPQLDLSGAIHRRGSGDSSKWEETATILKALQYARKEQEIRTSMMAGEQQHY